MIRSLHLSKLIGYFRNYNLSIVKRVFYSIVLTTGLLFLTNSLSAQTISETFEETPWTTVGANAAYNSNITSVNTGAGTVPVASLGSLVVPIAATSAQVTITTYNGGGSGTVTTAGPASAGNLTWIYSAASRWVNTSSVHSASSSIALTNNNGFLITPSVGSGISVITFWANTAGAGTNFYLGLKTNFTAAPLYPTAGYAAAGTGAVTAQFPLASTLIAITNGNGLMVQYSYTVTGTISSVPAELVFADATAGPNVQIDDIEVTASPCPNAYTWTGAVDSNWSVAANWTCSILPGPTNHVIIPAVTRLPVLTQNVTIDSCTLNTSATITLNGWVFTNNGEAIGTGKYIGTGKSGMAFGALTTGTIYFATAPTGDTLGTLTLADGAKDTIASTLMIASTGVVTVGTVTGAKLVSAGNITLVSDNNGWARIAQVPTNLGSSLSTISGAVSVQCYMHSSNSSINTARRAWRLLTAPITNNGMGTPTTIYNSWQDSGIYKAGIGTLITVPAAQVASSPGLDYGINSNYSMYTWNTAAQTLVAVKNTSGNPLGLISGTTSTAANVPYFIFVRGDRTPNTVNLPWYATVNNTTLSATGILQLGDQTFSSSPTSLAHNQFFMVGNPYACSVNFKMIAGDTTGYTSGLTNLINRIYIWNANLAGSQGIGGYVCIDDATNSLTYTDYLNSRNGANQGTASYKDLNIQSGQAFFMQDSSAGVVSVKFTETTKTLQNNYIYRPESEQAASAPTGTFVATLSLLNSDSTTSLTDGVVAQFKSNYCDCIDYADAPKFANGDEMFSLARYGNQLAIERRPEVVSTDTLFLNLKQMTQRPYQFEFTMNMPNHPGLGARLEDSYTGTKQPLHMAGVDTTDFTIDANSASQDTGRFKVVFGSMNIPAPIYSINAIQQANTVLVHWSVSDEQNLTGYALQKSTDGGVNYVTVYTTTAQHTTGTYSWIDANPVAGTNYYRVIGTDILDEESSSPVATVTIAALIPSGIIIFPNPIQNGQIGIAVNNMPVGEYRYYLLNDIGQNLQTGTINHPGGNATYNVPLNKNITKGAYELEVFAPDNTKHVIGLIY